MPVQSQVLSQFPELVYGFSTATDGNMSYKKGDPKADNNNNKFYTQLDVDPDRYQILNPELRHGGNVAVAKPRFNRFGYTEIDKFSPEVIVFEKATEKYTNAKDAYRGIDACLSNRKGCLITIRPADCAPVFLYCPSKKVFGIAHASTASLFSDIIERTINMMRGYFGCDIVDIFCFAGPCISGESYELYTTGLYHRTLHEEISPEEAAAFDPKERIHQCLLQAGVTNDNIEISPVCTASSNGEFFSNHSSQGQDARRHLAVIGLR